MKTGDEEGHASGVVREYFSKAGQKRYQIHVLFLSFH